MLQGGLDDAGAYDDSVCAPFGATCTSAGAVAIECETPADCPSDDAGAQCCGVLGTLAMDSCENIKGSQFTGTLCNPNCALLDARLLQICGSPKDCPSGTQCLPVKAGGINLGYCATSSFTISPPFVAGTIDAGATTTAGFTVTNGGAATSSPVTVAIAGAGYSIASTTCTTDLLAKASCNVVVELTASAAGTANGTLIAYTGGTPVATALMQATVP